MRYISPHSSATALIIGMLFLGFISSKAALAEVKQDGLFGAVEISSDNLAALPQWLRVIANFPKLAAAASKCDAKIEDCQSQQMTLWRAKIGELKGAGKRVQIQEINRFVNGWKHIPDSENAGIRRWSTPLEFITNGGDSEGFAVMKYVSLKELGIRPGMMRIVIANDVLRNKVHAVLSVFLRGKIYILDSLNNMVLEENLVHYYVPLYSVNEKTRWAHIPRDFLVAQKATGSESND
ncbi:MAG: transglutaminase-like cysteine peptidase [Sneathiella sp.]|nr:transglutaminase-like cysteine peptidase [Sneathiella sp.]